MSGYTLQGLPYQPSDPEPHMLPDALQLHHGRPHSAEFADKAIAQRREHSDTGASLRTFVLAAVTADD